MGGWVRVIHASRGGKRQDREEREERVNMNGRQVVATCTTVVHDVQVWWRRWW